MEHCPCGVRTGPAKTFQLHGDLAEAVVFKIRIRKILYLLETAFVFVICLQEKGKAMSQTALFRSHDRLSGSKSLLGLSSDITPVVNSVGG